MALDDISVTAAWPTTTPPPSATPAPSAPLFGMFPTTAPSTGDVTSGSQIQAFLNRGEAVALASDVALSTTIKIQDQSSTIAFDGQGFALSGQDLISCLYITNSKDVTIRSVRISNGNAFYGAGVLVTGDTIVKFVDVIIQNNTATRGGGIFLSVGPSVTFHNSIIVNNVALDIGGGVTMYRYCSANFVNSSISHNRALGYGGGIHSAFSTSLTLTASRVLENFALASGGGVYVTEGASCAFLATDVSGNAAHGGGGGFYVGQRGSVELRGCTITENRAIASSGGGTFLESAAAMNISDSFLSMNYALGIPFVSVISGSCVVTSDCVFSPGFPLDYGNNELCILEHNGTEPTLLSVQSFSTEQGYDILTIEKKNGESTAYSGNLGPDGVLLSKGDTIKFTSDTNTVAQGFEICKQDTTDGGAFTQRDRVV